MALTRQQKEQTVASMASHIGEATSAVFLSFDGISLTDINDLRDRLHTAGCAMQVIPKRLLKLALGNVESSFDPTQHEGQVAVIWGPDAVAPAKTIYEFAKGREDVSLRAGVLEGEDISLEQVSALAKLPTRDQLLGQLVSVLAGPSRGLVGVLSGVPRATVYVLSAIKEQKESNS